MHESQFNEDQQVWMFCPMKMVGKCPKLQKGWTRPWTVQEEVAPGLYRIQWGWKKKVLHGDLLKPAGDMAWVPAILVCPEGHDSIEWCGRA